MRTERQKLADLSANMLVNSMVIESGFNFSYAENNLPYDIVLDGYKELVELSKGQIKSLKREVELDRRLALELSKKRPYEAVKLLDW